jgi:succinate-acetate transporter protein
MLNAIQALIFSILTLMFIVLAIESHEEEDHVVEDAGDSVRASEAPTLQPAH